MKRGIVSVLILAAVAAVAYLATVGCCQTVGMGRKTVSLMEGLHLTPVQKQEIAVLEKDFLAGKQANCQALCEKRAQLIPLIQQENPDQRLIHALVEEIGAEQIAFEKTTLDHLLALSQHLSPPQRQKLMQRVIEELRTACRATACGETPGCAVTGK